jgi:hypothetical protein
MQTQLALPDRARALACRRKFLRFFRGGFHGQKYVAWERGYKEEAHLAWEETLGKRAFAQLLEERAFAEIAARAVRIESRTNLLFSFEKMALRDAVRDPAGAEQFAKGLFASLWGKGPRERRFLEYGRMLSGLPRKQTRVHTWPLQTVFGFIAKPESEIFLKPLVTKKAAEAYGYDFEYGSRPTWNTYRSLLGFAEVLQRDLADLQPRDLIDLQSFIWVLGSSEYE